MFAASADLYDPIYGSFKDYPAETARLAVLIRESHPDAHRVPDVACGTAEHACLLTAPHGFAVDGLDLDPAFVRIARAALPGASVFEADMINFDVPNRYDVILCLFSAIGDARTLENVVATLRCMRSHLASGGIVIVEPWFPPGLHEAGRVYVKKAESRDVSVCRMSHHEIDGRNSRLHLAYLIGRPGGIERATEVHQLGMFTQKEMQQCFRAAGFQVTFDPAGLSDRGLYVARAD